MLLNINKNFINNNFNTINYINIFEEYIIKVYKDIDLSKEDNTYINYNTFKLFLLFLEGWKACNEHKGDIK